MDGVVVIDKSEGWTSHDVVAKFRGAARTRRVGHLGTLDPMATGVLPLAVGLATRLARFYTGAEKLYEGGVRFGFSTDTYDRTGTRTSEQSEELPTEEQLRQALDRFRGAISQVPPQYSAKKVGGIPAYKSARRQVVVELAPVRVEIHELEVIRFESARAELRVRCSGGTYIRSLAHDLGEALGCGAHLDSLRRLASAEFTLRQAQALDSVNAAEALIPLESLTPQFPVFSADSALATAIRQGRNFSAPGFDAAHIRAFSEQGSLLAVCEQTVTGLYHPFVVF